MCLGVGCWGWVFEGVVKGYVLGLFGKGWVLGGGDFVYFGFFGSNLILKIEIL